MNRVVLRSVWLAALVVICVSWSWAQPELLTWDELITLYQSATPPPALAAKLRALLTTPFVSNAASEAGKKPLRPSTSELGPFLRVVQWNIERGLEFDGCALHSQTRTSLSGSLRIRVLKRTTTNSRESAKKSRF